LVVEFKLKGDLIGTNLLEGIKSCTEDFSASPQFPAYVCWNIWHERNKALFEDSCPSILTMIYKTKVLLSFKPIIKKDKIHRDILITHNSVDAFAWFDGATQKDGNKCAAGGVIKTTDAEVYKWTYNCGSGTNTKAELLGAWATFMLAKKLSISSIQVMGDSKVIIEWLMNKGRLKVAALEGWKITIKELTKLFRAIKYQHNYRDFNISKLALEVSEGYLYYHQWISRAEGPRKQIRIH